MANTVKLVNHSDVNKERNAAAVITPGHLIELTSANTVQVHATADVDAVPMFATEDELRGNGIADAFAAGEPVQCWLPGRGDEVNAILADGETVVIGDWLSSNGDGTLKKWSGDGPGSDGANYSLAVVAQSLQTLDLSGSSGTESSAATGASRLRVMAV